MKEKVKVKFLIEGENGDSTFEIIAVFPEIRDGDFLMCYAHLGQHSNAHIDYVNELKPATAQQYRELESELTNLVGYDLEILNQ